jgi:Holliday junction resolvase
MFEVEFDLRDMGVERERERTRALDKKGWTSVVRKAKSKLEGVYC